MTPTDPLRLPYADNRELTMAARLAAEIADDGSRLDIASGYFAPSVWAAVGDALKNVKAFRLLLGRDHELDALAPSDETRNIEGLVRAAIDADTQPDGLVTAHDAEHQAALIAFLEAQQAAHGEVVKLWRGDGFLHAKAYLLEDSAGVGSANFTFNGLERNRELVGWRQDRDVVGELRGWFDRYWDHEDTAPYTDALLEALRAAPLVSDSYTPHDVLIRTLAARYGAELPPSLEQAAFRLRWFQEDAVFRLVRLLNGPARGALLADAVGLGKTFMALGVIHHYLYRQAEARRGTGRPVLLVVPASLEPMWAELLEREGLAWACHIVSLQSLRSDFDWGPYRGADLVVIDEAHRLRGGRTWFRKAMDLLTTGERAADRRVLLLTATPVNTGMGDLKTLLRVLTKNRRNAWAPEIADFERQLDRVEREGADPFPILDRSLVRRSRSDILRAEKDGLDAGLEIERVKLPKREAAHIDYAYDGAGAELFDAFAGALRRLALAPYDLDRYRGAAAPAQPRLLLADEDDEAKPAIRPGTIAALYAAGLLTRFQSSLPALRRSLVRLDGVLARFLEALEMTPPRLFDLAADRDVRRLVEDEASGRDSDEDEGDGNEGLDADALDSEWREVLSRAPRIEAADDLRLEDVRAAVKHDRDLIATVLERIPPEEQDGKVAALVDALRREGRGSAGAPALAGRRVLVFSQFRVTARYVHRRLEEAGIGPVALIDGAVPSAERRTVTAWFDPDQAGAAMESAAEGGVAPQTLVSTDVLAEGHNLQLADTVVNFDLHFNPQVAVQRAGRVDRLNSPHPRVWLVSMLPPEDLDRHIGLLARLDDRFRLIHGLGLGDERVVPLPGDVQGRTLEQMRKLYRDDASVLDEIERTWSFGSTDFMRQPLSTFIASAGRERLKRIPAGVSSVKRLPRDWRHGPGVFLALAGPAARGGEERETYWRFYPDGGGEAVRDDVAIFSAIACRQDEPRAALAEAPPGPGVFDWALIGRAADALAGELTLQRSQADIQRGASERSRKLRQQLRANTTGLAVDGLDDLLERLLQVRVEDFDAQTGWRAFDDDRRLLARSADDPDAQRAIAERLVRRGLDLFGPLVAEDAQGGEPTEVKPNDIQLVAYEVLVGPEPAAPPEEQMAISVGSAQGELVRDEGRLA